MSTNEKGPSKRSGEGMRERILKQLKNFRNLLIDDTYEILYHVSIMEDITELIDSLESGAPIDEMMILDKSQFVIEPRESTHFDEGCGCNFGCPPGFGCRYFDPEEPIFEKVDPVDSDKILDELHRLGQEIQGDDDYNPLRREAKADLNKNEAAILAACSELEAQMEASREVAEE